MSLEEQENRGDVGLTDAKEKVNVKDDFISKLEVILTLSKRVLYGLFVFWASMTTLGVATSVLSGIQYTWQTARL